MNNIGSLVSDAHTLVQKEFGFDIENSKINLIPKSEWNTFCISNGFNSGCSGLYVPFSYSAYINSESPNLICDVFHELFGHGLFYEKSMIGRELASIIQDSDKVMHYFYDSLDPFSQRFGLCNRNISNYEGFAMWCEAFISEETGYGVSWRGKKIPCQKNMLNYLCILKKPKRGCHDLD
jgi:hypothetical protein